MKYRTACVAQGNGSGQVRIVLILAVTLLLGASGLLILAARDRTAEIERLVTLLDLDRDTVVADIGAGSGWLTVEIAERIGAAGHVYSTELNPSRLDDIRESIADAGLTNVTVIAAGELATNLPVECCDAIFMRRVYHHVRNPTAINASLYEALRPGGALIIVEFERRGFIGTVTAMGIEREPLTEAVTRAGFELVAIDDWPGWDHYVAIFRKPNPAPSTN